jgi:DNA-binding transcriptional MerR regulator
MFTVKQLSRLSGVTPRTLHHYDAIGLLKPARIGENGYRYYSEESVLLLQQILFYRELDLSLDEIKKIMGHQDFDVLAALECHKFQLGKRIVRLEELINTVDNTISNLKGKTKMSNKQLFSGFSEEEQEKYAIEAEQMYDPETVRTSNRKWKSYSAEQKQQILDEGQQVYVEMLAAMHKGPGSPEVQALVGRWRAHMDYFWTPNLEQLIGLASMYKQDPRFKEKYDQMHPELAAFILSAVELYVADQKKHA